MVNILLLDKAIEKSGMKRQAIADRMGISRQGFYAKMRKGYFTTDEAAELCDIVGIHSKDEKIKIFFAPDVDKNGNMEVDDNEAAAK